MAISASYACCCCCCVTSWIIRTTLAILALLCASVLFFFIFANPNKMKVRVTEASLTQFDFNELNDSLIFNLEFDLSIRNPNRIIGFYYDYFEIRATHQDKFIETWPEQPFYQGRKNTTVMSLEAAGKEEYFSVGSGEIPTLKARFDEQKRSGVFDIDLSSDLSVRAKIGSVRIGTFLPEFHCGLKVPLVTAGKRKSGVTGFNVTECRVEFKADSIFVVP